jgi:hypothetical protein
MSSGSPFPVASGTTMPTVVKSDKRRGDPSAVRSTAMGLSTAKS